MDRTPIPVDLVRRLRSEDNEAWNDVVALLHPIMYRYMLHNGHDLDTAEDLTQETFLKAFDSIEMRRDETAFRSWLFGIATNTSVSWYRRNGRDRNALKEIRQAGVTESPADQLVHKEKLERLRGAVSQLCPEQPQAVALHHLAELSTKECAEILEIPEGTVKSRVYNGMAGLRERMADEQEMEHERQAV